MLLKEKQRFSLRKLSVGLASVFLGTTLFTLTSGKTALADTTSDSNLQSHSESNNDSLQDSTPKDAHIVKETAPASGSNMSSTAQGTVQNAKQTIKQNNKQAPVQNATDVNSAVKQDNTDKNTKISSAQTMGATDTVKPVSQSVNLQTDNDAVKQSLITPNVTNNQQTGKTTNTLTVSPNSKPISAKVYKQQLNDTTDTTAFHHIDDDYDPYKGVTIPSNYSYGRVLLQDDKSHVLLHEFDFSGHMNSNTDSEVTINSYDINQFLNQIGYSLDDADIPSSIKLTRQNMGTYIMSAHYADFGATVDRVTIGGDATDGFTATVVSHADSEQNTETIKIHHLDGTTSTTQYQQYTHISSTDTYEVHPVLSSESVSFFNLSANYANLLSRPTTAKLLQSPPESTPNALFTNLATQTSTPLPVNTMVTFGFNEIAGNYYTSHLYSYDYERIQIDPDGKKTLKMSGSLRSTDPSSEIFTYHNITTDQTTDDVTPDSGGIYGTPSVWKKDIEKVNFDQVSVPVAPAGYDTKIVADSVTQKTLKPLSGAMDHDIDISFVGQDQNKKYVFVDDMDKQKVVDNQIVSGITGQNVAVNLSIPHGYDLAQGQILPNSYTFTVQNADQIIHLTHKITPISYQNHLGDENFNKTIKRNIQFINPDWSINDASTTQTVTFHRDATRDEVTGAVHYLPWSENGSHTFDAVIVPTVKGYTPNGSVNAITVTPNSNEIYVNIVYIPAGQNSQINYVDEKGTSIATQPLIGKTDETINVTYQVPANWHIVSGKQDTYHFKADNNTPIKVVIAHDFKDLADQVVTVTRTVNITDPHTQAVTTKTQTATFTRSSKQDLVDGHVEHGDWDKQSQHFDAIDAPQVDGYTPDKNATNEDVTPDSKNETINIHYLANAQTNSYMFVDDDNKQQQVGGVNKFAGQTDQNVKLDITAPTNYVFAQPDQVPASYTFKAEGNQQIVVHLKHKTADVTSGDDNLTRTISRTVNITNPDNHTTSTTESVVFKRTGTKDLVTGTITYNPWTKAQQTIPSQTVPAILGYTASGKVDALTVTPESPRNTVINITYSANPQQKTYTFVDDMNNDSVVGSPVVLHGVTAQTINTDLTVPKGYVLASGQTLPVSYTFDAVNNPDEQIHLTHKIDTISHKDHLTDNDYNVTITRNVSIIDPDGKQDSSSTTQSFTFYRNAQYDEVTGKTTFGSWNNNGTYTFASVNVPPIKGYAPSGSVDSYNVTPASNDVNVTVNYNPVGQINYVDSQNKTITTQLVKGHTDQTVTINYQVPTGWHIVSGAQDTYHFKAENNTPINVIIAHTLTNLPNTVKTVTRTINITDPHTLKTTTQTQTATFTRSEARDMVTGATIDGTWDKSNQTFDEVDAPNVDGYTPDKNAAEIIVTPDSKDSFVDIHYIAGAQSNSYSFVDDDAKGQTVGGSHQFGGVTDQTVKLDIVAPANYVFSNPHDVPTSYTFKADSNTAIIVHVKHKTANVTDTDSGSHVTIARTINITTPSNKTTTTTESVTFTRKATKDLVTGNVTYGAWSNGGTQTLPAQPVPAIIGYTPSGKVDAITVTPNSDKNIIVNITYTANPHTGKISYVDQSGTEIGSTPLTGKTDETINVVPDLPYGWVISKGQDIPSTINVKPTGIDPVIVKVEHGKVTIDHTKPVNPTDKMPDGNPYPKGLTRADLNKSINRVITVIAPDGKTSTVTQTAAIYRDATVDEVTRAVTYTDWSKSNWDKYDVPTVIGYTPSIKTVLSQVVTSDTKPAMVTITYTADSRTGKISYVDESGKEIGNTVITGKVGENVTIVPNPPKGWVIVDEDKVPKTEKVTEQGIPTVIVNVKHGIVVVTPDNPKTPNDKMPNGDNYPKGVGQDDLNATYTRHITIIEPTGQTINQTQTSRAQRVGYIDAVTGKVTYSDWHYLDNGWSSISVPKFNGYKPSVSEVPAAIKPTQNENVVVTYQKVQVDTPHEDNNAEPVKPTITLAKDEVDLIEDNNPFVDLSYRTKQKMRGTDLDKSLLNNAHNVRSNGGGLRNAKLNHKLNTNMISETATIAAPSAVIKTATMVHNNSNEHGDESNKGDENSTLPQTGSMHESELAMLGLVAIGMGVATAIGAGLRKKEN